MSKTQILLVGGNKRQYELLDRHLCLDQLDLRHVRQSNSRAQMPKNPDVVIFWVKHCSHKLEALVGAQVDMSVPKYKVMGSKELLEAMIDELWDQREAFKYEMQLHPQTGDEYAVPTPILKTKYRLQEFWHDIIGEIEPTAVDPEMDTALQGMLDEADIDEATDNEDDPMFVGSFDEDEFVAAISPRLKELMNSRYASKVTVMVEIEDQTGDVVAQRTMTLECDGRIREFSMLVGHLAQELGESVGEDAREQMNKGE